MTTTVVETEFDVLKEFEKTVLEKLVQSFGLDFILLNDKLGGEVDTIHNVRQGIFATKKEKENKKKQKNVVIKEIRIKPHIDEHDKETKISQIKKFIEKEYKVKISLRLSGREKLHAESAVKILDAFADSFEETAIVEKKYGKEQVQKFVMLSPKK